jgi:ABC-type branched-subunit amino acid transport system permease subunit
MDLQTLRQRFPREHLAAGQHVDVRFEMNVLVVGVMLVVFVVGAPEGILGLWKRYVLKKGAP